MLKFLKKGAGIETVAVETEEQIRRRERHANMVLVWNWLRNRIDRSVEEYQKQGFSDDLEILLSPPVYERLLAQLEVMREQGLYWHFPKRIDQVGREVTVIDEQTDSRGAPTSFTIQEVFHDTCQIDRLDGTDSVRANGARCVLRANILVLGGRNYQIQEIRRVTVV